MLSCWRLSLVSWTDLVVLSGINFDQPHCINKSRGKVGSLFCRRNGASGCGSSTCWTCWTWKETNASFCEPWPFQFKNPLQPWDISRRFWIWGAPIQQASFMVSILALSGVGSKTATRAEFHQESRLRPWRSGASGVLASSLLGRKPVEAAQRGDGVFLAEKVSGAKCDCCPWKELGRNLPHPSMYAQKGIWERELRCVRLDITS